MTRAEEVAKMICAQTNLGIFTQDTIDFISTLPEFQPGRELTAGAVKKERDELKAQLEAAKSQQVGVTKDQVKAAFAAAGFTTTFADETYEKIAAALSPKWIRCSDRMPEMHQKVFWLRDNLIENGYYAGSFHPAMTHWMPRYVPEPPKEEESEQIKRLREAHAKGGITLEKAIEIVKEFEKGAKK